MAVRGFLLSLLTRQHLALREKLAERYPHDWLVWEPGHGNAPAASLQDPAKTRPPSNESRTPQGGDALCFEVRGASGVTLLRIGREASANEIILNDATVSREHALLICLSSGHWMVEARSKPVMLESTPIPPGSRRALVNGAHLVFGDVLMTFYTRTGVLDRLAAEGKKLAQAPARQRSS